MIDNQALYVLNIASANIGNRAGKDTFLVLTQGMICVRGKERIFITSDTYSYILTRQ